MSKKLCERQAAFVREYLVDLNATQAAKRAGYSEKTAGSAGTRLLQNVAIQEAIQKAQTKRAERVEVTQDFVLRGLIENYERAMTLEPIIDRKGDLTGFLTYEGAVANRSLELLGKHLAMFTDVKKIEGDLPPMQVYLTDAEDDAESDTE